MRLLLIRHGQTPSNILGALDTAVPGPGLTELGIEQAAAVPEALSEERIDAIYASTQTRAQLTAAPLAESRSLSVSIRDGLREISAGDLEMKTDWNSIVEYHSISFSWIDGDRDKRIPGGENGVEVLARFDAVVREAADAGHDAVAFVAHGQVIRVWTAANADNISAEFASKHLLHNTGVVVCEGSPDEGWTALAWSGVALGGPSLDEGLRTGPGGAIADA